MSEKHIIKKVEEYYSGKIRAHGATPAGVDWNSRESQELRFSQLLKVVEDPEKPFSLLDYGCGFGSMYAWMKEKYSAFSFLGLDISPEMIREAVNLFPPGPSLSWKTHLDENDRCDYVVASGIFNVRQETSDRDWEEYMLSTLNEMDRRSVKGFSFNVLTKYSDKEYMKDYLYYADPLKLFDYCKTRFSKQVALLHDYPLYEFTMIVKK